MGRGRFHLYESRADGHDLLEESLDSRDRDRPQDRRGVLRARPGARPTDSTATHPEPSGSSDFFYRATVSLVDLGNDAVPEITQAAEPAPREAAPHSRILDR